MTPQEFKSWLKGYLEALRDTPGYTYGDRRMYDESVVDRIQEEAEKVDAGPGDFAPLPYSPLPSPWDIFKPSEVPTIGGCSCPVGAICLNTVCPRRVQITYTSDHTVQ